MKKIILAATALVVLASCENKKSTSTQMAVTYPTTQTSDHVDTYHGTDIQDPYRWLEDDRSEESGAWVKSQNKVTGNYLDQIRFRESVKIILISLKMTGCKINL